MCLTGFDLSCLAIGRVGGAASTGGKKYQTNSFTKATSINSDDGVAAAAAAAAKTGEGGRAVSYTHLTLPTIYSV